jgi:hypothetical protein
MARLISPPEDQLDNLRTPLEKGERLVFNFFNKFLPIEWEIYVQPHLNGLRPDFVLLHPNVGIAVFEVKDWNLSAMEYKVEQINEMPPRLIGYKDGKEFLMRGQNPIEKIFQYKQEICELYCPRLGQRAGFVVITAGLIFPFSRVKDIINVFKPYILFRGMDKHANIYPISGYGEIESGNIKDVFPEAMRQSSRYMNPDLAQDLRNWLIEPVVSAEQRLPLELDPEQKNLINTKTSSGYRRMKGPAGSGKSLIIAARASKLSLERKEVLVLTYNITLLNYLRDLAVRWPAPSISRINNITWLNYHYWCKRVCQDTGNEDQYHELWSEYFNIINARPDYENDEIRITMDKRLPELVGDIINSHDNMVSKYDAILVDEGQDFQPNWWNVLRRVCKNGGEMWLAADATQDIYGKSHFWTDKAMIGAGFKGPWIQLKVSYRMPPIAIEYARKFAERFLPIETSEIPALPEKYLDHVYPCELKWVQTDKKEAESLCADEIFSMAISADPKILALPDIIFLSSSQKFGKQVLKILKQKGIKLHHTFADNSRDARRLKMFFFKGDARVKATTVHSFKGWESRALVVHVSNINNMRAKALLYTSLTRLNKHPEGSFLTVVSSVPELADFGKEWPIYQEK